MFLELGEAVRTRELGIENCFLSAVGPDYRTGFALANFCICNQVLTSYEKKKIEEAEKDFEKGGGTP